MHTKSKIWRLSALAAAMVTAYQAPALAQEEDKKDDQKDVEVIQIRGFAASQQENLNVKRFSSQVVDAITAEDIGKFPDKNVGDALQRIPGVAVERRFGEADGVSIRGLDPSLSMTYLNNQAIATAQWFEGYRPTRGFRSDMLASELVAGLEVYKSPQADLNAGSIGGTVNIKTRRPLDLDPNIFRGSIEYQYSENAERWDPALSGLYSWKSEDETWGVLATVSHQERFTTYDGMENYYGAGISNKLVDDTSGATNATWGAGHAVFQQQRERSAFNLTAQYRPTDALDITANYLHFSLAANNVNSNYLVVPGRAGTIRNVTDTQEFGAGTGALKHDIYLSDITGDPGNDYWFGPDTFFRNTEPTAETFDVEIDYQHDNFDAHFQLGQTEASGDIKVFGFFGKINTSNMDQAGLTGDEQLTLDLTGNKLGVTFDGFDPTDPNSYPLEFREDNAHITDSNKQRYAQADFEIPVDMGPVIAIKTGLKYHTLTQERHLYNFTSNIPDSILENTPTIGDLSFVDTECGLFEGQRKDTTLTCLPLFDLNGVKDFSLEYAGFTKQRESLNDFYEITEDRIAAYAMAKFDGENYRGNFGLRYVDYQLDSIANQYNAGDDVWIENVKTENDYTEVLPSLNLAYNINEDLIVRFAAAKVIALPNYEDLKNTFSFNDTTFTGSAGNPFLNPWSAKQFDLGIEWYFDEASLASITYFRKDIDDFLFGFSAEESVPGYEQKFIINRTRNGGSAELDGIEAQFQTELGYGFGMVANYTWTDASVTNEEGVSGLNLPGNSEKMWNVTGYWENETYSARIMANHRGGFFNGFRIGTASLTEDFTSVDVALSAEVNEYLTLNLQGLNLTGELYRTQNSQENWGGIFQLINDGGTRWFVNASVKF
ncbi:hypothetical protein HMF8227_00242 [Saliniradius amylolyticus]|uniref:TonB-dependent receptor n=1 Tax=Saliniradius amylolyticus TaxID=2183582 RepID=A0A2S2E0E3_9ALTE|nr:TonB-dependent receptor [Saliniradius amylolyticus]AWL10750.1 hypothetical protein HMF8227_00242 [Saliniradius amylolyticus]